MIKKPARIKGEAREKLRADLRKKYEKGSSIRTLARQTELAYGTVHNLLTESGVNMRGRGGWHRSKQPSRHRSG